LRLPSGQLADDAIGEMGNLELFQQLSLQSLFDLGATACAGLDRSRGNSKH
jgi:hypothetical protein